MKNLDDLNIVIVSIGFAVFLVGIIHGNLFVMGIAIGIVGMMVVVNLVLENDHRN